MAVCRFLFSSSVTDSPLAVGVDRGAPHKTHAVPGVGQRDEPWKPTQPSHLQRDMSVWKIECVSFRDGSVIMCMQARNQDVCVLCVNEVCVCVCV